jgi:hypothetical protein
MRFAARTFEFRSRCGRAFSCPTRRRGVTGMYISNMPLRRFAAVLVLPASIGCARTAWVNEVDTPRCRGRKAAAAPPIEQAIGGPRPAATLSGRVIRIDTREPVTYARVMLSSVPTPLVATTDSLGRFRFSEFSGAPFIIRTFAIGMNTRTDSSSVIASNATLTIPLEPAINDGPCSGLAAVPVRKPWWWIW